MEQIRDLAMENTLCGFEIDPLTGNGHFFQLLGMIGLPTIPVVVLAIYSSIQLAGGIVDYFAMRKLNNAFTQYFATEFIVTVSISAILLLLLFWRINFV